MYIKIAALSLFISMTLIACNSKVVEEEPSKADVDLSNLTNEQKVLVVHLETLEKMIKEINTGVKFLSQIKNGPTLLNNVYNPLDSLVEISESLEKGIPEAKDEKIVKTGVVKFPIGSSCQSLVSYVEFSYSDLSLKFYIKKCNGTEYLPILTMTKSSYENYSLDIYFENFSSLATDVNFQNYDIIRGLSGSCNFTISTSDGSITQFGCSHISSALSKDRVLSIDYFNYSSTSEDKYSFIGAFYSENARIFSFWANVNQAGNLNLQSYADGD